MISEYPKLVGLFDFIEHNKDTFEKSADEENDQKSNFEKSLEIDKIYQMLMMD